MNNTLLKLTNSQILHNLRVSAKDGLPIWLRIPLIGGFNANTRNLPDFIAFFQELTDEGGDISVEVLPYHEYGREKWEKCGLSYKMKDAKVDPVLVLAFEEAFREAGIHVVRT